ncbi:FHA domain-containing protein [Sanguibacter antarcticus]|uniref:FHA domain-containing protein n=1 Tax=Sanguibacter antarcticus TaxID=372484 RepID=A0A2A9E7I6_9MICO|nr:FHA domain-containing protein [Sanguibacter antarcticus]PFG34275.1 FHA domain-containing protein [Sanguibacter antarcticus]
MIVPTYVAGDWFAVITDGAVALLPGTVLDEKVAEVWEALRESPDLTHGLTVLARGGLVGLPPFALVSVVEGHVRGFLRGNVRLLVADASGTTGYTATHVATWAEINVPDAGALTVAVPADLAPRGRQVRMPALAAVVRASSVEVTLRSAAAAPSLLAAPPEPGATGNATTTARDGIDRGPAPRPSHRAGSSDEWSSGVAIPSNGPVPRRALEPYPAPAPAETTVAPRTRTPAPETAPAPAISAPTTTISTPTAAVPVVPRQPDEEDDDSEASTVLSSSLVEIRKQMPGWQQDFVPGPFSVPPVPKVHKIRMASGLVVPLDRAVLIGRAPVVSRVAARDLPRLVTVASPNQDISRTHAQVRADGDDVLVTDLNSTNGMLMTDPGQPARRLRSGEPTPLLPGALVDLGDGVTFVLESDG